MGDVVNLRMARKRAARAGREKEAERNRAASAAPKSVRRLERARAEAERAKHEAHRLDTPDR